MPQASLRNSTTQHRARRSGLPDCDVAVIGAGPYGLSAAAHLRTVKGLETRVFGEAMSFWAQNMPTGMFLRSGWTATHIADPHNALTLEAFQAASGTSFSRPVPLDCFVEYGRWYQQQAVPDLDRRVVARVESASKGFRMEFADGETMRARRVVVATGIGRFAWRPPEFKDLPGSLVSHASEHHDLHRFAGKNVLVIGGGQSALESGALLHDIGAQVEIVARRQKINWLQGVLSTALHYRMGSLVKHLLYAPTDVGPAGMSQLMARPELLRRLPRSVQNKLWKRAIRPAGSRWLVKRLADVPIRLGCSIRSVSPAGDRVKLRLHDGSERIADHILLGTGYRVDIAKYEFLGPALLNLIERRGGYPVLTKGLETSVPGLHLLGAPAAWSFGPLMQIVSGTRYASAALLRSVAANSTLA